MRELGVLADAKARIDREEGDQPVLELRALGGGGRAGERLQPCVHLQRVGGDRNRPLAAFSQPVRDFDRDFCLAHAGRTEQGDHVRWRHRAGVS